MTITTYIMSYDNHLVLGPTTTQNLAFVQRLNIILLKISKQGCGRNMISFISRQRYYFLIHHSLPFAGITIMHFTIYLNFVLSLRLCPCLCHGPSTNFEVFVLLRSLKLGGSTGCNTLQFAWNCYIVLYYKFTNNVSVNQWQLIQNPYRTAVYQKTTLLAYIATESLVNGQPERIQC